MPIEILEADLSDPDHAAGLVAVLDSYARDPIGGAQALAPDVVERLIPALRSHPTTLALLAREQGGTVVGIAICFRGFSTFRAMPLLNVHDLAVLPELRGRGIGRRLLDVAEARARALGCCKLTLEVREDNHRARGLYESFGFGRPTAGGEPTTTFFLEKFL